MSLEPITVGEVSSTSLRMREVQGALKNLRFVLPPSPLALPLKAATKGKRKVRRLALTEKD